MTERAFVAGATGYTGRAVVAELCRRGVETHAHVRPDSSRMDHWQGVFGALGARVDTTPWQPDALKDSMERIAPTVVFALLGTTRARARALGEKADDQYMEVDYRLTAMLLEACGATRQSDGPRFVYLSAIGVRPDTRNAYYRARAMAEEAVVRSGLPYIIARPSFITGPGRDESRTLERAGAAVGDAVLAVVGALGARRLRRRWRSTTNEALGASLVRAALEVGGSSRVVESEDL